MLNFDLFLSWLAVGAPTDSSYQQQVATVRAGRQENSQQRLAELCCQTRNRCDESGGARADRLRTFPIPSFFRCSEFVRTWRHFKSHLFSNSLSQCTFS